MRVVVLFGGKSTENEISCLSAASVLKNISKEHEVIKIGITKKGEWFATNAPLEQIKNGTWDRHMSNKSVLLSVSEGTFVFSGERFRPDVVFPVLHGKNGEDGTIQGLLEIMNIPYVGCGVFTSAVCMDKAYAKIVFKDAKINQVEWVSFSKKDYSCNKNDIIEKINKLGYPVFVKPSNAGSSVGITKCKQEKELESAFNTAFAVDRKIVVEKSIENPKEIEVSVYGNDNVQASCTGQILPSNEFYDYEAKYISESSKYKIPSMIEKEEEIRAIAVKAYKVCDCKGFSRVDFLIDEKGEIYLNEINTIPGFTDISMFPKLCNEAGIKYDDLIDILLNLALEYQDK